MQAHPLILLAMEIAMSALLLGFTSPFSILRPASIPITSACVWFIIQTSVEHMVRSPWAALVGGFAVSFFFQYLDVILLSKWSFYTQGPTYPPSNRVTTSGTVKIKDTMAVLVSAHERIAFAMSTLLNFRFVGTPYQVKNVPPFSGHDLQHVPGRGKFLRQTAITAITSYLMLDALTSAADPDLTAKYLSMRNISLFSRFEDVSVKELGMRLSATISLGISMSCVQRGIYSLAAFIAVACGLSNPSSWPPLYGSVLEAYTIRRFWR